MDDRDPFGLPDVELSPEDAARFRHGVFIMEGLFAALGIDPEHVGRWRVLKESDDSLNKGRPDRLVINASASGMSDPR